MLGVPVSLAVSVAADDLLWLGVSEIDVVPDIVGEPDRLPDCELEDEADGLTKKLGV